MLNFFILYAISWGAILFCYLLGWSNLCVPLEPALFCFFSITILASILLGIALRKEFRFKKATDLGKRDSFVVIMLVLFFCLEFVYCRQIPLLSIVLGNTRYTSYTGIPTLHPLVCTFGSFYIQYLFYRYLCNNNEKKALRDYFILMTVIYLLQYNRGGLLIAGFMSLIMYISANEGEKKKRKGKWLSVIVVLLVVVGGLFAFGVLGNLRHGFAWNDSSYIQRLGRFNGKYPGWLPKQFMWPYIYIISPVANINYCMAQKAASINIIGYAMTYLPDFLVKRVYPGEIHQPLLVMEHVFNATAGFGTAYMNAGILGMYILFMVLCIMSTFIMFAVRIKSKYRMPMLAIMNSIIVFMFFTHTLYYSAIGFPLIYPVMTLFSTGSGRRKTMRYFFLFEQKRRIRLR